MCRKKVIIKEKFFSLGHRRCHYCCAQLNYAPGHKNSATVEHMVPKSKGGTLAQFNLLVICRECNVKRGNKDFVGFVTGSEFPRQQWLLDRYSRSKQMYGKRNALRT